MSDLQQLMTAFEACNTKVFIHNFLMAIVVVIPLAMLARARCMRQVVEVVRVVFSSCNVAIACLSPID